MSRKYFAIIAALPLVACSAEDAENSTETTATQSANTNYDLGYEPKGEDNFADRQPGSCEYVV